MTFWLLHTTRIRTSPRHACQVMEVVLDFVMAYLEFLTSNLEATAHPILDSIVHKARPRHRVICSSL